MDEKSGFKRFIEASIRSAVKVTDPVMPPRGHLECFKGRLSDLIVKFEENYFAAERYKTLQKSMERADRDARLGALVALLSGNIAMAAGAAYKRTEYKSEANFIQAKIDDKVFTGWLGSCPFNVGDDVEIVAEWQDDHYEIYAMARPCDRMIAMFPNCRWGCFPFYWASLKAAILLGGGIFSFFYAISLLVMGDLSFNGFLYYWPSHGIAAAGVTSVFAIIGLFIHCKDRIKTTVKLSEQIFTALGWKNVSWINLRKSTKKRLKQIKKETGEKPNIADFRKKPINRRLLDESFLYYY